jgi:cobyrinic acid a,c-diamide synthase
MERPVPQGQETVSADAPFLILSNSATAKTKEAPARIAVARDNAFCFYYQDNLDRLTAAGAELIDFSPLEDTLLPPDVDGIYLGGGYPELFASQLTSNKNLRTSIRTAADQGMPIYGECGGFMYLCMDIRDVDDHVYPMCGCLPFSTRMLKRLKTLGYREITLNRSTLIGKTGQTARGHEFHYSEIINPEAISTLETVYSVTPRSKTTQTAEGYRIRNTLGSYIHLHFGSNPDIPRHLVAACRTYRKQREKTL